MSKDEGSPAAIQDHAAFLSGKHDFQSDIEKLAASDLVGTILETVMLATEVRFAAVARVTADRWVACRTVDEVNFGLREGDEIEIQSTFCQTVRDTSQNVLFNDVATDDVYKNHPIAAKFGIVSYASTPIRRSDGGFFGTLCAIDTLPRGIKAPRVVAMLEMFADIIGQSLETEERLEAQEQLVEYERELSRVQEEFVGILGHDLRNPLAAFDAGLRQLENEPQADRAKQVLSMLRSPVQRMSELIDNVMLHTKARLGGGIKVKPIPNAPLEQAISEAVEEIRTAHPECEINLDLSFQRGANCDAARLAQAVSNLLSNAVSHGEPGAPIQVRGTERAQEIEISVANRGEVIPDELNDRMHQPFQRGNKAESEGLGLGLYIASSIAKAHGGRIECLCERGSTIFQLKFPFKSTDA